MVKKIISALLVAGLLTATTAMAETVYVDGYSREGVPAQFSIDNVIGECDKIEIQGVYYDCKTYEAKSPAKITMLVDDIFLFEVFDTLNGSANLEDGAIAVTYDGFGNEYNYVPYEKQVEGPAVYTTSKVMIDGEEVAFEAYNINGNNYFKLRDLGEKVGFSVDWDAENNCIMIDTTK